MNKLEQFNNMSGLNLTQEQLDYAEYMCDLMCPEIEEDEDEQTDEHIHAGKRGSRRA